EYVRKEISQGHSFAGFDLRVAGVGDLRAERLSRLCGELAVSKGQNEVEQAARVIERVIGEEVGAGPSIDWPLSRLLWYLGFDPDLFKAVAAIARDPGWAAHAIEQSEHNQLPRPRGRYVGPARRTFVPLEERG